MLLAFALEPLVHLLCVRTRLRRHHASGIVVFLFVAMLYGLFYATYLRAESFLAEIPAIAEKIRAAPMVESLANRAEELNRVVAEAGRRIVPPAAASARPKTAPSGRRAGCGIVHGGAAPGARVPERRPLRARIHPVPRLLHPRGPGAAHPADAGALPRGAPRDGGGDPPRHRADDAEVPPRERRDRPHPLHGDRLWSSCSWGFRTPSFSGS